MGEIVGFIGFFVVVWLAQTIWEFFAGKDTNDYGYEIKKGK